MKGWPLGWENPKPLGVDPCLSQGHRAGGLEPLAHTRAEATASVNTLPKASSLRVFSCPRKHRQSHKRQGKEATMGPKTVLFVKGVQVCSALMLTLSTWEAWPPTHTCGQCMYVGLGRK